MNTKFYILIIALLLTPFIGKTQASSSAYASVTIMSASEINTAVFTKNVHSIGGSNDIITMSQSEASTVSRTSAASFYQTNLSSGFELTATGANAFSISMPNTVYITHPERMDDPLKASLGYNEALPAYMEGDTYLVKVDAKFSFGKTFKRGRYTTDPFEVTMNHE